MSGCISYSISVICNSCFAYGFIVSISYFSDLFLLGAPVYYRAFISAPLMVLSMGFIAPKVSCYVNSLFYPKEEMEIDLEITRYLTALDNKELLVALELFHQMKADKKFYDIWKKVFILKKNSFEHDMLEKCMNILSMHDIKLEELEELEELHCINSNHYDIQNDVPNNSVVSIIGCDVLDHPLTCR